MKKLNESESMIDLLLNILAIALAHGESFLPDTSSYDDLFYKLVETGDILAKFRDAYELTKRAKAESIDTLINVSKHYQSLLESEGFGKKRKILRPQEVQKIIQQGYETLSIQAKDGLDQWEKFREADHKAILKKIVRIAIEDTKRLINIDQ